MKYPIFLKRNDTIGVVAPSLGVTKNPRLNQFITFKKTFNDLGFTIKESKSTRRYSKGASNSAKIRAEEFVNFYKDSDINFILSCGGGEIMNQILPYIDFEELKNYPPKFFMGYSDNTNLTFLLTTILDVASIYGDNATSFGRLPWNREVNDAFKVMLGKKFTQKSYPRYENITLNRNDDDALKPTVYTRLVKWQSLEKRKKVHMEGRFIGGCLDCLQLLVGTPFDKVQAFQEKYKDDGIIFYLEACDLNVYGISRALWQLKQAGWFRYCKGIVFGRPLNGKRIYDYTLKDALESQLKDLEIPVIYDVDIGHVAPRMTIINGCYAYIDYHDGEGKIRMVLK